MNETRKFKKMLKCKKGFGPLLVPLLASPLVIIAVGLVALTIAIVFLAIAIPTIIRLSLIALALALFAGFTLRATGFNPLTLEVKSGDLTTGTWAMLVIGLFLLFGLPYAGFSVASEAPVNSHTIVEQAEMIYTLGMEYWWFVLAMTFVFIHGYGLSMNRK